MIALLGILLYPGILLYKRSVFISDYFIFPKQMYSSKFHNQND